MPFPRSFYFLRHGETDNNKQNKIQGWIDSPLNETGRAQAASAIHTLEDHNINRIISSPLSRALETAEIINTNLQMPLFADENLKERGYGIFEGKSRAEFDAWQTTQSNAHIDTIEANGYPCPENAEPYGSFQQRIMDSITEHLNAFANEKLIFVAHGGIYRALCRILSQELTQAENAKLYLFEKDKQVWSLKNL